MINAFAAFKAGENLKPFVYDPGEIKPHEIEIDVQYCGLCHSDLSILENQWGMTQYPVVPGHEVVGKVSLVGKKVKNLSVGQVVGLGWHAGYCNECPACRLGDQNLCPDARATIIGHHGGFADKVRAAANSVVLIPEGLNHESAGPLLCGGTTVFNPLVQFGVKPTDRVAVIGIGGLGHIALQFLHAWGCEVTAFTSSEIKRNEALNLGAHHTLNSRVPKEIEEARNSFDLVISTVNVKLDWNLYLRTLANRGRFHFVGVPLEALDIDVFSLLLGQRSISGSLVGSPATMKMMLEFAVRHNIKPIIEKFKFEDINQGIEKLRQGKAHYRIVFVNPPGL